MADGGQILSQLFGNNPLQAYAQGAQISASLASLNQNIAAQTFQNNLSAVELAQRQSQNQFQNQATAADVNIHSLNADTQSRYANNALAPNSIENQLKQARINQIMGKTGNLADAPPPAGPYNPLAASPPSVAASPDQFLPNNFSGTPTAAAPGGGAGVLPALGGSPAAPVNPIAAAPPDSTGSYTPSEEAQGLHMAAVHQQLYGQSYEDSLNPDNDPSPDELKSAQGVKQFSDTLAASKPQPNQGVPVSDQNAAIQQSLNETASNPLNQAPGAASLGTAPSNGGAPPAPQGQGKIPVPPSGIVPPGSQVQPTNGWISRGNRTGYTITRDSDGTLAKTEGTWDPKLRNAQSGGFGDFRPIGKSEPIKIVPTASDWVPPATKTDGDTTLKLQGTTDGPNGVKSASYKAEKGDGQWTVTPLTVPGTDHVKAYGITKPDGSYSIEQAPDPKTLKAPTAQQTKELESLYTQSKVTLNPDDADTKVSIYNREHPKATKTTGTMTGPDWSEAYQLVAEYNRAPQKLTKLVTSLQKSGYELPSYFTDGLSTGSDAGDSKLPAALRQFAPGGK